MTTSSFVKIMASNGNQPKKDFKEASKEPHEIIVIDSGDSVKFDRTKLLITRKDGEKIEREVPGYVYVMNNEGITISTFQAVQ